MTFIAAIDNLLRKHYAPKSISDVPKNLANALRAEGATLQAQADKTARREAFLDKRHDRRLRAAVVFILVGFFAAMIFLLTPQVFNFEGSSEERSDDLGNMTSLLFLFLAVSANGVFVIVGSFPQRDRWVARLCLFILMLFAFGYLLCASPFTVNTIVVGLLGLLLTILMDIATPKSDAVDKKN